MKSSIVQPRKLKSKIPATFPALYRSRDGEIVILATNERGGTVIHSTALSYPVGFKYSDDDSSPWETATAYIRVTEPMVIKFQP